MDREGGLEMEMEMEGRGGGGFISPFISENGE